MKDIKKQVEKEIAIDNFANWFAESKTKDTNGEPEVLYCGTLSEFSSFDIDKTTNNSFLGKGFYISTSYDDVNTNYSNTSGPDFKTKKELLMEEIRNNPSEYLNSDFYTEMLENVDDSQEIYQVVKGLFEIDENEEDLEDHESFDMFIDYESNRILNVENEGFILPVYLKAENPIDIDNEFFSEEECFTGVELEMIFEFIESKGISRDSLHTLAYIMPDIDIDHSIDFEEFKGACEEQLIDETDEDTYEEILEFARDIFNESYIDINYSLSGSLALFKNSIKDVLEEAGEYKAAERLIQMMSVEFQDNRDYVPVIDILNNDNLNMDFSDVLYEDGILTSESVHFKAMCAKAFQKMGYDSISLRAANHFKNMDDIEDAIHYIVFAPNQIKSAIGNNGEYSINDDDIRYRINSKMNKEFKIKNKLSFKEAAEILEDVKGKFPNAPVVHLITDLDLLDKDFIADNKHILDSSGYYSKKDNKVFINLQNIDGKQDFVHTIAHEVFGHMSLQDILDKDYYKTMDKIYDYYDKSGDLEVEKMLYKDIYKSDLSKVADRAKIAEEKFANFVEKNGFDNFPLKNVIIGAVKKSLRKVIKSISFNENDIIYIAQQTHNNLKDKNKKNKVKRLKKTI